MWQGVCGTEAGRTVGECRVELHGALKQLQRRVHAALRAHTKQNRNNTKQTSNSDKK
jgi:hypothetical protein